MGDGPKPSRVRFPTTVSIEYDAHALTAEQLIGLVEACTIGNGHVVPGRYGIPSFEVFSPDELNRIKRTVDRIRYVSGYGSIRMMAAYEGDEE